MTVGNRWHFSLVCVSIHIWGSSFQLILLVGRHGQAVGQEGSKAGVAVLDSTDTRHDAARVTVNMNSHYKFIQTWREHKQMSHVLFWYRRTETPGGTKHTSPGLPETRCPSAQLCAWQGQHWSAQRGPVATFNSEIRVTWTLVLWLSNTD